MKHETTCVDKPQQDGRVERKHRNLLEMGRALRFQCGLPLKFWGDFILTAVHISNRLPTQVLNNLSPYEVLYDHKPNYNSLKVFRYLSIAVNPERKLISLNPEGSQVCF